MAVWSEVMLSDLAGARRLDAEYYDPQLLRYESEVRASPFTVKPLGQLVKHGYRVVYENTTIFDREEAPADAVRFLQAANVSGRLPVIHDHGIGWVHRADWVRYPKGRIHPGEILVEVKGKAEKVAIVPDDFPTETLVTGTLFKFQVDEVQIDRFVLLAYLLSRYGCGFRHRCLTNTLIGFVSKGELYDIPVPILTTKLQQKIRSRVEGCLAAERQSREHYAEAEALLESALGLDKLDLTPQLFYERPYADVQTAARFDAEYFQPRMQNLIAALSRDCQTIGDVTKLSRRYFKPKAGVEFQYIEIGDVSGNGTADSNPVAGEEAPSRATWIVKPGDVITTTVRPIRRLSAIITDQQAGHVCSSGFAVLTSKDIAPELLLVYLRLPLVCELLDIHTTASMYPAISTTDLMKIPIALPEKPAGQRIVAKVRESFDARREARQLLDEAKAMVEDAILGE